MSDCVRVCVCGWVCAAEARATIWISGRFHGRGRIKVSASITPLSGGHQGSLKVVAKTLRDNSSVSVCLSVCVCVLAFSSSNWLAGEQSVVLVRASCW